MSRVRVGHAKLTWRTALTCNGGTCVTVAVSGQQVFIGDSKFPDGPTLSYSAAEWQEFLAGAKRGDFDDVLQ